MKLDNRLKPENGKKYERAEWLLNTCKKHCSSSGEKLIKKEQELPRMLRNA